MLQAFTHPIRVFVLEDQAAVLEGLQGLLDRTPERDLLCVGGALDNSPGLSTQVKDLQTDVVLADLILGSDTIPDRKVRNSPVSGLEAIQMLRRTGSPDLKIIAYSNWSHLRNDSLSAGANTFLSKSATADALRHMLRHVMGRVPSPPNDPYYLGRLTKLDLFPADRTFILHGEQASTTRLSLERPSFALLHYLALERQQKAQYWVERLPSPLPSLSYYCMQEAARWQEIAASHETSIRTAQIPTSEIARWATKINNELRGWFDNTAKLALIHVPGSGKTTKERRSHYTLHPNISSEGITIHAG